MRLLHITPWDLLTQRPHHFVREDNLLGNQSDVLCFAPFRNFFKSNPMDKWAHKVYRVTDFLPGKIQSHHQLAKRIVSKIRDNFCNNFFEKIVNQYDFIIINNPYFSFLLKYEMPPIIYDCVDDWSEYPQTIKRYEDIQKEEDELVSKAKTIWCVSPKLIKKFSFGKINKPFLIPNGCDFDCFYRYLTQFNKADAKKNDKPVIMYIGAIFDWIDVHHIEIITQSLKDYLFLFYGPINDNQSEKFKKLVHERPNIFYKGVISYGNVPQTLAHSDVCIIPFKNDLLSESVSPIKFYEYLSMGKPVVSTPMPDVLKYQGKGVAYACTSVEEWVEAIREAYALRDDPGYFDKRIQIARENSWKARWQQCLQSLETHVARRGV